MIPPSVKERLLRLQHENKKLKASSAGSASADSDKSKAVLQVQKYLTLIDCCLILKHLILRERTLSIGLIIALFYS